MNIVYDHFYIVSKLSRIIMGHLSNCCYIIRYPRRKSLFPVALIYSIGHLWNASFHLSFLILDSLYDSLDGGWARRKAAT
jgi:hypothetical protein